MSCPIELAGARLELLPDRAIWWADEATLLIADLHLGKPASFRAGGAPVPEAVTVRDLDRLTVLVRTHGAERLVVLGDLAHDQSAWGELTLHSFSAWREAHAGLDIVLVPGNHDQRASPPPERLRIRCVEAGWRIGPLAAYHDPATVGDTPALCGHLHPGVRLEGRRRGGGNLRAPCFWFTPSLGVLPAFGSFTGCAMIRPAPGDRVYALGAGAVVPVDLLGADAG